jgi:CHAT domain-containing protein
MRSVRFGDEGKTAGAPGARGCLLGLTLLLVLAGAAPPAAAQPVPEAPGDGRQQLRRQRLALHQEMIKQYLQGRYAEAAKLAQQLVVLQRRVYPRAEYPNGHPELAATLTTLGTFLQLQGEPHRGLPYAEQAVAMYRALYPTDSNPNLAAAVHGLGMLHRACGDYAPARAAMREALAMRRKLYPPERYPQGHADLAHSLNDLGALYQEEGNYQEAETHYRQAVAMFRSLYPAARFPQGDPHLAVALQNLGLVYKERADYGKAGALLRQALAMKRQLYPESRFPLGHPDLASSLTDLGNLSRVQGNYAEAEAFVREGLAMRRKLYPPNRFPRGHVNLTLSLNSLGQLLQDHGRLSQAEACYQEALDMLRGCFPPERFPHGHLLLFRALQNMGTVARARGDSERAEAFFRDAVAMARKVYPEACYPDGHPEIAANLNGLGAVLRDKGQSAAAEAVYHQTLAMQRRLYPAERYPRGHAELAATLSNLGTLLHERGEYTRAETFLRDNLAMLQKLYPPEGFPRGHPELAVGLNNLGYLYKVQGQLARAEGLFREALAMDRKLYPQETYPDGHPLVAAQLINLGLVLHTRGDFAGAEAAYADAVAMCRKLYPAARYPRGHADLARGLGGLGSSLKAAGRYDRAEAPMREELAMQQKLYPPQRYPHGHKYLAQALTALGSLLAARGDRAAAEPLLRAGLDMQQGLSEAFVEGAAEAQALNLLASLPLDRDGYLSATRDLPDRAEAGYALVWRGKALVSRTLERRRQALLRAADEETRNLGRQLAATRQAVARLLLTPAGARPDAAERLAELTERKEALERKLAARLPALAEGRDRVGRGPAELGKHLPQGTVFIDLLRYVNFSQDPEVPGHKGLGRTTRYTAFLLRPGQPVRRVELGPAAPVEAAITAWRRALAEGKPSPAAATLRRLVWAPLAEHLPAGTATVWLAPDAALTGLPWAALPGAKPGTVLLEKRALAVVPHGPFLLEHLTAAASRRREPPEGGTLLAVGGVAYDRRPADPAGARDAGGGGRPAPPADAGKVWAYLPGTAAELDRVLALAGTRPRRALRGAEAGVAAVLAELPKARWAHLATHGFFADKKFRSFLELEETAFALGAVGERVGAGARSPLVLSGLVLAGANVPAKDADKGDGGILTAEAIAGLDLDRLELAVLSACDTSLGEVAGGEGVFGLQRAFHLAGCKNVVASLWQVDDEATAALMALFYHHLWREKTSPLEALRQAQLTLYRHPERAPLLARARGPDFDRVARRPAGERPPTGARAPARLWAGFVLSGVGQ